MNELQLPKGYVSRAWIEREYMEGKKQSEQLRASVTRDQIEARLTTLSSAPGGMNLVAKELRSPLLREMLYEGRDRNLAVTYKLSQGESAEFWSDVAVPAAAIGVDGLPAQVEVKSDYVRVDTRLYTSNPFVRWNQNNLTKFDILNSVQQRAKASMMLQEAAAWFRLVRYASGLRSGQGSTAGLEGTSASSQNAADSIVTTVAGQLSIAQLADGVASFGSRLVEGAKKLWINPRRQKDLVLFNVGAAAGLGFFAPNTQEALLKKGYIGDILGMEVVTDIVVPYLDSRVASDSLGSVATLEDIQGYILGPAEYVGVIAIRTDLTVETMKDANRFADVFALWQDLGMYVRWCKALQRLTAAAPYAP